jgi:uncharacterized protein YbgA (DUF1722 family)/uncharacterized protein YbbK (DUF523 family)
MNVKPKIVFSACLGFESCRYNGQTINAPFVSKLAGVVDIVIVCPERDINLGIPRDPLRLVDGEKMVHLYQPATGRDVTEQMTAFTAAFLDNLAAEGGADGFVLKNRSPSCGIGDVKIYHSFKPEAGAARGAGLFGGEVKNRFSAAAIEDEGRLNNFTLREHFLIKLFAAAAFRKATQAGTIKGLLDFHTNNKLLFMAYNQEVMREMGRILASYDKKNLESVRVQYSQKFEEMFQEPYRYTAMINVLLHGFGGLSQHLSKEEVQFFLNTIEEYRDERVPLSVPLHLLKSWAIRHQNDYLLNQSFIAPYPRELTEISDSGKGRNL